MNTSVLRYVPFPYLHSFNIFFWLFVQIKKLLELPFLALRDRPECIIDNTAGSWSLQLFSLPCQSSTRRHCHQEQVPHATRSLGGRCHLGLPAGALWPAAAPLRQGH
jgi:hypothetical protein